jgi:hypothetical protein
MVDGCTGEGHRETRIVELPVKVLHAPEKALLLDVRNSFHGFLTGNKMGGRKVEFAGECIVHLQPDAEEGTLPPLVAGDEEREVMNKLGCILVKESPLPQCLEDKRDVSLLEIANTPMNKLGAAARSPLGKVRTL